MNRDIYNRRRRRVDEYASTMSTHPQWEKRGFPELQNAYAQKCGRISYAVGNNSQISPLSRKFARIVSDIFVSQAIVHIQIGGGNKT